MPDDSNNALSMHLAEQGLGEAEIHGVLRKLEEYDKKMIRESVFDSIERGSFSLDAIIAEAMMDLSDEDEEERERPKDSNLTVAGAGGVADCGDGN